MERTHGRAGDGAWVQDVFLKSEAGAESPRMGRSQAWEGGEKGLKQWKKKAFFKIAVWLPSSLLGFDKRR